MFINDDEGGWAAIYQHKTTDEFMIIGNNCGHPFVVTPLFEFNNSDGSTDWINIEDLNVSEVKKLIEEKAIEYIFNQIH